MKRSSRRYRGFTLMETLLAIALIGTLISIFLTIFVPARGMVRQALTRQESERITGTLRAEMSTLRGDELGDASMKKSSPEKYLSTFDKGFYWLQRCAKPGTAIVIFSYRADTSKPMLSDGTFPAVPAAKAVPGANSQLITVACPINDPLHRRHIRDAVGPVFLVRMTQLIPQSNGEFTPAKFPGVIEGASSPDKYVSAPGAKEAWGGVIFYRADFYHMSPPDPARYRNRSWAKIGRPLFSANLSFRR